MTDIPTAPEWARQWTPQTEDDSDAAKHYDDATITRIATTLELARGMDQDVLAGLIRQLASEVFEVRRKCNWQPDPARFFTPDKLKDVATQLQRAAEALDALPGNAKSLMAGLRSGGGSFDDWCRDLDYIQSAPEKIMELATLAERLRGKLKVKRGAPQEDARQRLSAVFKLCSIYHTLTGMRPVMNSRGGFEVFVAVAIEPLWPDAGEAGRITRRAVGRYRNSLKRG